MHNISSQSMVRFHEPYPSVAEAVAALNQPQLDRLLAIARRRLERLTLSRAVQRLLAQSDPADFVQDAILLVLAGELKPGQGRRTGPRHLASHQSFFNFLQGVIQSRISSHLNKLLREGEHCGHDHDLPSARTVTQDVELNEIKAELSTRLRACAGDNPALLAALAFLELETPETDRQPTRKQLHKMRRLGRQVLQEMADGKEPRELFLP